MQLPSARLAALHVGRGPASVAGSGRRTDWTGGGNSLTLDIFGKRLNMESAPIRAALDDPAAMNWHLWRYIPKALLADVERQCYVFTRDQLAVYLTEFMPATVSL